MDDVAWIMFKLIIVVYYFYDQKHGKSIFSTHYLMGVFKVRFSAIFCCGNSSCNG